MRRSFEKRLVFIFFVWLTLEALCPRQRFRALFNPLKPVLHLSCCHFELIHISNFSKLASCSLTSNRYTKKLEDARKDRINSPIARHRRQNRSAAIRVDKDRSQNTLESRMQTHICTQKKNFETELCKHFRDCALKPFSLHFFNSSFELTNCQWTLSQFSHLAFG